MGESGQVTIPKGIRDRFAIGPDTEVEFDVVEGLIVLRKRPPKLNLKKWKGRSKDSFAELGDRARSTRRVAGHLRHSLRRALRRLSRSERV